MAWDYCEAGCPVTAECPPGWVQLPSGCYQTRLEVEAGVDRCQRPFAEDTQYNK